MPGPLGVPGFRQTLADTLKETDRSELVLLVTPHLAARAPPSSPAAAFRSSTSVPPEEF